MHNESVIDTHSYVNYLWERFLKGETAGYFAD